jgi:hypothetical protein
MPPLLLKKKILISPSLFRSRVMFTEPVLNQPVREKKSVPYRTDQKQFGGVVRTSGVCEPVGPVGFTNFGLVLVTLVKICYHMT